MKILILSALCVVAALSSPLSESENLILEGVEYVKVPNGYGGVEFVKAEEEIYPMFDAFRDTRFLVFTRFNPTIGQEVRLGDLNTIRNSNFSPERPTRILIHGWQSNINDDVNILPTAAYLRNYDVNVIVIDWSIGANTINYLASRNQVNNVGGVLAEFLDTLIINSLLPDYSRVSCIGHHMGAHVCGAAGKRVQRGRINTIFGLDPAGRLFDADVPTNRLAVGDAAYVEIIHTDTEQFGIGYPLGDSDFYPNGGTNMPGCLTAICDHGQGVHYFVESLNSERLWGRRCTDFAQMRDDQCLEPGHYMGGEPSNFRFNLSGIFRMPTNSASPFGIGRF